MVQPACGGCSGRPETVRAGSSSISVKRPRGTRIGPRLLAGGRDNSNELARVERLEEKVTMDFFFLTLKLAILSQCASAVFSVFQTTDCSLVTP